MTIKTVRKEARLIKFFICVHAETGVLSKVYFKNGGLWSFLLLSVYQCIVIDGISFLKNRYMPSLPMIR